MPSRSYALADLTWDEVRTHLETDRRLIVAVGAFDQYGPHLPLGAGTRIAEALARDLSAELGVLRAPTLPFGANVDADDLYPGAASLRPKTLHLLLNELLADWEDQGFEEIVLVTAQSWEPHVEAMATVNLNHTRVRVVDALALDLSSFVAGPDGPEHGGEVVTSLLMHLEPDAVRGDRLHDVEPPQRRWGRVHSLDRVPRGSPGNVGFPSRANAEKGRLLYNYILEKIREKVFRVVP